MINKSLNILKFLNILSCLQNKIFTKKLNSFQILLLENKIKPGTFLWDGTNKEMLLKG